MNPLVEINFKKLIAKETNARMRIRLLALAHIKEGANRTEICLVKSGKSKAFKN